MCGGMGVLRWIYFIYLHEVKNGIRLCFFRHGFDTPAIAMQKGLAYTADQRVTSTNACIS